MQGLVWIVVLLALALGAAWLARRYWIQVTVQKLYRRLSSRTLDEVPSFWARELARLPKEQASWILERLADRMVRSGNPLLILEASMVQTTVMLVEILDTEEKQPEAEYLREVAGILEIRARQFEALHQYLATTEGGGRAGGLVRCVACQDLAYAEVLRAERPAHLAALQGHFLEVDGQIEELGAQEYFEPRPDRDLIDILDIVDQAERLPGAEDRALYLGQALSRTLTILDHLEILQREDPHMRHRVARVTFEKVRLLLAASLEDIRQRAVLKVRLHSWILPMEREAVVVLEIENIGEGHARNIFVDLEPGPGFHALERRQEVRSLLRHQSARLEFLVEPKISDRVRLSFQITYDDLERQGIRREFADRVEFRQTRRLNTFHPMRPNPYVVGRPLLPTDLFVGRETVFAELEKSLRTPNPTGGSVVLVGSRRMGKTSMLRRLQDRLGEDYVTVLVDLQGLIGSGEAAFFRELTATLCDELEEMHIQASEPPPRIFDEEPGEVFLCFLEGVEQVLEGRRLVLLFDELEVLEARMRSHDLDPGIVPYLGETLRQETGVRLLLTGIHRLDELTPENWRDLGEPVVYHRLDHLPREKVDQLFVEPTEGYFELDRLALDKIYQLTGGHPHFSQLLARELVDLRNQRRLSYITIQDVNAVAERVAEKGQLHITYLFEDGSQDQQLFLLVVKELLDRKGMATLSGALRYMEQRGIGMGDASFALQQLVRREILEDKSGLLSFRMELLRLWLDRNFDAGSPLLAGG